jgi:hypothetical protein
MNLFGWLIPTWVIALTGALAGAALAGGVQELRVQGLKIDLVELRAEGVANTAAMEIAFRAAEQATQERVDKEAEDGKTRLDDAQRDADAARTAADGLRAERDRYRDAARAAANSGSTDDRAAAADAINVLADMFARADATAGELAAAADIAHAAGTTCERAYDTVRTDTAHGND